MTVIALLGTGHMGAPIARRLLAAGHQLTVWNRTPARAAPLTALGAGSAGTPAEAVAGAEIVITMLTDAAAVESVLFGPAGPGGAPETGGGAEVGGGGRVGGATIPAGAVPAMAAGTIVVDMSTIGPDAVRDLARRLPPGIDLVDAPVGGSVDAAEAGTLRVFAGGPAPTVDRVAPVLAALGTVRRCGPTGSGAALKLVLNTSLVTGLAALADTLAVAAAVGIDRETALEVLAASPLSGAIARGTNTGASFAIALAAKDIDLAIATLGGTPAPVARAAAATLRAAPDQSADLATLV
ncbi:NAD(P)-dependent oxidoreductase [Longispora sp. K20-0274]|uniref:NAD(P)-dependent oxidoreductase n=1 Tax=Longispora sp. K20-0274 TaxID=3088255 RepID=UPI003999FD6A